MKSELRRLARASEAESSFGNIACSRRAALSYSKYYERHLENLSPVANRWPRVCMNPSNRPAPLARTGDYAAPESDYVVIIQKRIHSATVAQRMARFMSSVSTGLSRLSNQHAMTASSLSAESPDRQGMVAVPRQRISKHCGTAQAT